MQKPKFVYVTYIRTTPEKLWAALTQPEFTRRYFQATWQDCAWKIGASWKMVLPNGTILNSGEVLEIEPPKRLVLTWEKKFRPEDVAGEVSKMTYELEAQNEVVKLTIVHESETPESKLIESVSKGWPIILASLKSLLETGESFQSTQTWPKDDACVVK